METTQPLSELQNLQTPKKEENDVEKECKTGHQSYVVSSRCTRSQVAPDWTAREILILIGEVASVEGDCLKALSYYQKWKIISDNCTAVGVVRSLNQCHRKWDSLLLEYKRIKDWESQLVGNAYWSLQSERRKEFGLPVSFDREVFESIGEFLKAQEDRCTDLDDDPEGGADMLDVILDSGSKKRRRRPVAQKSNVEDEQEIVEKLRENSDFIHAILRGDFTENEDKGLTDLRNIHSSQTKFTRNQADELIKVLGTLASTVNQLYDQIQ
ncbi:PREDICTED: trihelix transcription factor ASR3 [Nelumbo nucifera]|nr:PREDICTED: trihelix transcription factor ASR3 [Nelumbo nucifera]XP_010252207.1 PREDICTED: trihelix transcription factor ASR3 [Nelumbo nucifera]XP_010252208.1 PREDICTED: trihelix transcription factor ASR3 [Nelumbo nucifera]